MHNILDSLKNLKKKKNHILLYCPTIALQSGHTCVTSFKSSIKNGIQKQQQHLRIKKDDNYLPESSGPSCMYIPNKTKSSSNCIYCQTILRMWNCYNGILTTRTLDSTRWFSEILAKNRHSSWLCHKSLLWWLRWIKSIWI